MSLANTPGSPPKIFRWCPASSVIAGHQQHNVQFTIQTFAGRMVGSKCAWWSTLVPKRTLLNSMVYYELPLHINILFAFKKGNIARTTIDDLMMWTQYVFRASRPQEIICEILEFNHFSTFHKEIHYKRKLFAHVSCVRYHIVKIIWKECVSVAKKWDWWIVIGEAKEFDQRPI